MDFFSRISPVYKSVANKVQAYAQPKATSGLSGLIGSIFGRATPAYKTADGKSAKVPASSSGFWSMFSASPSYKTAPAETVAQIDSEAPICAIDDAGDPGVDEGAPCDPGPDQIVVL